MRRYRQAEIVIWTSRTLTRFGLVQENVMLPGQSLRDPIETPIRDPHAYPTAGSGHSGNGRAPMLGVGFMRSAVRLRKPVRCWRSGSPAVIATRAFQAQSG